MKTSFGTTKEGKEVTLYTIENEHVCIKACDYGAILVALIDKDTGIDVSQGFDSVEGYIANQGAHIGASIGRTANRIEKGILHLNGKVYQLPITNSGNTLHGGVHGFDTKMWSALEEKDQLTFRYTSPDGEEGYPGNLYVKVVYRLLEDGVAILVEGTADQDTVFAYTNHSYFNCDQSEDAMEHIVSIPADYFAPTDEHGLTLDSLLPVADTPFDFRVPKAVGRDINDEHPQIKAGNGYDHYFDIPGTGLRHMATIEGKRLALSMASDFPGFHMYTANFSKNMHGKYGLVYDPRSAICLEAEYLPNGINYEDVEDKPIVRAGETMHHEIRFTIKKR
jgi:aldose 1-epimerase